MGFMTNMKGSLKDAGDIFRELVSNPHLHKTRGNANKVVMVLSDGYPNTELDGRVNWYVTLEKEVVALKRDFVEIYAVAVNARSNLDFMKTQIATEPSLYIYKPTFNQLGKLSKAIRGGKINSLSYLSLTIRSLSVTIHVACIVTSMISSITQVRTLETKSIGEQRERYDVIIAKAKVLCSSL